MPAKPCLQAEAERRREGHSVQVELRQLPATRRSQTKAARFLANHSMPPALERLLASYPVPREMKPSLAKRSVLAEEEGPHPGRSARTQSGRLLARQPVDAEAKGPLAVHSVRAEVEKVLGALRLQAQAAPPLATPSVPAARVSKPARLAAQVYIQP